MGSSPYCFTCRGPTLYVFQKEKFPGLQIPLAGKKMDGEWSRSVLLGGETETRMETEEQKASSYSTKGYVDSSRNRIKNETIELEFLQSIKLGEIVI